MVLSRRQTRSLILDGVATVAVVLLGTAEVENQTRFRVFGPDYVGQVRFYGP
jgi:hypothetical protein